MNPITVLNITAQCFGYLWVQSYTACVLIDPYFQDGSSANPAVPTSGYHYYQFTIVYTGFKSIVAAQQQQLTRDTVATGDRQLCYC